MVQTYGISLVLVISLSLATITSARYLQLQGTDERGKRRKRSIGAMFESLTTDQRLRVLNRLLAAEDESGDSNMS